MGNKTLSSTLSTSLINTRRCIYSNGRYQHIIRQRLSNDVFLISSLRPLTNVSIIKTKAIMNYNNNMIINWKGDVLEVMTECQKLPIIS